jgi:hypothetical protein
MQNMSHIYTIVLSYKQKIPMNTFFLTAGNPIFIITNRNTAFLRHSRQKEKKWPKAMNTLFP